MTQILLTIGIPVLNGMPHIANTLEAIFREAETISEHIELLVIDNGSTDGTSNCLQEVSNKDFIPKNVSIHIVQNLHNMGFDDSCENLIWKASGRYLWILGAQEILLPTGLSTVMKYLEENPWQVVINSSMWDEASNKEIHKNLYKKSIDELYDSPEDFFHYFGGPCLSLSANISRLPPLLSKLGEPTTTKYWSWLERFMDVSVDPERDGDFIFISQPIIQILIEDKGWQRTGIDRSGTEAITNAHPIYFTFIELTEIAKRKFASQLVIRNAVGAYKDPFGAARSIAMAKSAGMKADFPTIRRTIKAFGFTPWFWFLGLPLLLTPGKLLGGYFLEKTKKGVHFFRTALNLPAK